MTSTKKQPFEHDKNRDETGETAPLLASRLALRPKEAAAALGISARKLWEITADQNSGIPHLKIGKSILYPVGPLEQWLAEQAQRNGNGRRG